MGAIFGLGKSGERTIATTSVLATPVRASLGFDQSAADLTRLVLLLEPR